MSYKFLDLSKLDEFTRNLWQDNQTLRAEVRRLRDDIEFLAKANKFLRDEVHRLEKENQRLKSKRARLPRLTTEQAQYRHKLSQRNVRAKNQLKTKEVPVKKTYGLRVVTTLMVCVFCSSLSVAQYLPFVWRATPGATKYHLQVSTDQFATFTCNNSTLTDTARVVAVTFGTIYNWHVRAGNEAGWGPWSAMRTSATADNMSELLLAYQHRIDSLVNYAITAVTATNNSFWHFHETEIQLLLSGMFQPGAYRYVAANVDTAWTPPAGAVLGYMAARSGGKVQVRYWMPVQSQNLFQAPSKSAGK